MSKRILLIEDEDIREIYKEQLEQAGFVTDAFATGKEGLEAALNNTYDLVLLDIILPDMNGLNILKQIRQSEKTHSLPVVLLTNLDQDIIMRQGFELGATNYLLKVHTTPNMVVEKVRSTFEDKNK